MDKYIRGLVIEECLNDRDGYVRNGNKFSCVKLIGNNWLLYDNPDTGKWEVRLHIRSSH